MRNVHNTIGVVWAVVGVISLAAIFSANAYEQASDCNSCHGSFLGSTSPQGTVFPSNSIHEMHRDAAFMGTDCMLCHTEEGDDPLTFSSARTAQTVGLGCVGCHVGTGLRDHHAANGITSCYFCHSIETPPAENVPPPYYGSPDTKVDRPGNDVLAANTNENWSVGDFLGLDNDGDNLYDQADFDTGPPYELVGLQTEGNDLRIIWKTVGGRSDALQAADSTDGNYLDILPFLNIPGVGVMTTNFLEVGGATNDLQLFRVRYAP